MGHKPRGDVICCGSFKLVVIGRAEEEGGRGGVFINRAYVLVADDWQSSIYIMHLRDEWVWVLLY